MSRHVPLHTFRWPPSPSPSLHVMVVRPAQVTQVTQVPITLVHEPLHCVACHRPPPPHVMVTQGLNRIVPYVLRN